MFKYLFFIAVLLVIICPFAFASEVDLSNKIIQLRMEVNTMSEELKSESELLKSRIQTLALEKIDLDSKIRRQKINLKNANLKLSEVKDNSDHIEKNFSKEIVQFLNDESIRIQKSIPYKKTERINYVQTLKKDYLSDKNSEIKTLQLIWTHVEDELQLAKGISIDKDILEIDGKSTLVEVAKVGMVMMFYKTPDGKLGFIKFDQSKWMPTLFEDTSSKNLVNLFFENLRKQIKIGFFTLPMVPVKNVTPVTNQNAKKDQRNKNV